ncbi:MAG TPA: EamA family transporter [Candidatus Limnocylindria bacterium]|nr:EamA family transporter [Candidatus Limnocylindria bacterium]
MIALAGGLGSALAWGLATLFSARSSRRIGAAPTLAWVSIVGFVACLPLVATSQPPASLATFDAMLLVLVGLGYIGGLLALYAAMARGPVGIAAPVASTEGGIAALIAVAGGEPAEMLLLLALAVVVAGVVVATIQPGAGGWGRIEGGPAFLLLAVAAAVMLGVSLYAAGHLSGSVPPAWIAIAGRAAGVLLIAAPLLLFRRLRVDRRVAPFVIAAGLLEPIGYLSFVAAASQSISVAAVLASQFAVVAVIGAFFLGERLDLRQRAGVITVALGVAAVAFLSS